MELDNREKVRNLLRFGKDTYYYLQILQRKKENPELALSEIKRWRLFITSPSVLDRADSYIEFLCKNLNARAYISVVPRNLEKYCKETAKEYINHLCTDEYSQVFRIGDRVALSDKTVKWRGVIPCSRTLLDFDMKSLEKEDARRFLEEEGKIKVEEIIPTKNGFHVICENHNTKTKFPDAETRSNGDVTVYSKILGECVTYTMIREANTIYYASWKEGA